MKKRLTLIIHILLVILIIAIIPPVRKYWEYCTPSGDCVIGIKSKQGYEKYKWEETRTEIKEIMGTHRIIETYKAGDQLTGSELTFAGLNSGSITFNNITDGCPSKNTNTLSFKFKKGQDFTFSEKTFSGWKETFRIADINKKENEITLELLTIGNWNVDKYINGKFVYEK